MYKLAALSSRLRVSKSDAFLIRRSALAGVLVFALLALATTTSVGPADPKLYLNDIKALAAPAMEGRGAGTKGLAKAAKYLEHRYKSLGMQPAGTNTISTTSPTPSDAAKWGKWLR